MTNFRAPLVLTALIWVVAFSWSLGQSRAGSPQPMPFSLSVSRAPDQSLRLRWTIAPGTYLYRDRIGASAPGGQEVPVVTPEGQTKDDPNFGPTEVYHDAVEATVPGAALAGLLTLRVTYQGCAERGICYPPVKRDLELASLTAPAAERSNGVTQSKPPATAQSRDTSTGAALLRDSSLVGVLAGMFGLGLLLAFTPCVLPMVPILSGMLVRSGVALTPSRGFALSGAYALSMAAAYASLGLAAAWLGRNLQVALQTPVALGLMALTLVALALSMFGLFDIQAPLWWRRRFDGATAGAGGSILGAALLGFSAALIVGPCVTPPLAAALLYVVQTGDVPRGCAALFALGLGMGTPLVAVGTFGAGILPRSGPWLVRAKQLFGFVFLALAISLVTRLMPDALALLLWSALAVAFGLSAVALAGAGTWGWVCGAAGFAALVYGGVLAVDAASGGTDPLRPLAFLTQQSAPAPLASRTATTLADLEAALVAARGAGRPALVEFAADWCSACRTNERTVLADAGIRQQLQDFAVIRADVTRDDPDTRALMRTYDVVGPPSLILFRADGTEVRAARADGELSVEDLLRSLALAGA